MVATVAVAAGPALASKPAPRPARAPLAGEVPGQPAVLALNFRGTARPELMAPDRFVSTTDLYSLATGERVGTATHDFAFTARPFVADHIMTFRLPEGQIVTHDLISFPSDPQHPGFFLIGIHPERNTILPGRGTGAYAGRSGRLRMSGYHDTTRIAGEHLVTYDDFYLIELDPK
jgi:hypothetical protein